MVQPKATEVVNAKPRPLTYSQREERRQKGLCFYCDEKFSKGHECKKPQIFLIIADEDIPGEYEGEPKFDEAPGEDAVDWQEQKIILAALGMESQDCKLLTFSGLVQGKSVPILIDGESSMNLVQTQLCEELGLVTQQQEAVNIHLPNGAVITSHLTCPELSWSWNGVEFSTPAYVADLKDWQVILGVEWLSQIGDLQCNFQDQTMSFKWKGHSIDLNAKNSSDKEGSCAHLSAVTPMWMEQIHTSYDDDSEIQQLITEATVVKEGPKEYYMSQGLLQYKGTWVIGASGELRRQIFDELHGNSIGGHSGRRATLKRIREYFYWPTINQRVGQW